MAVMHSSVEQAIQEIDAAVANGDTFDDPRRRFEMIGYAKRWIRLLRAMGRDDEADTPRDECCSDSGGGCELHPRGCP